MKTTMRMMLCMAALLMLTPLSARAQLRGGEFFKDRLLLLANDSPAPQTQAPP